MKPFWKNREILGWLLLAAQFLLGLVTLYWGAHVDEADNLVVGDLILHGAALYKDVFSHHFPFPYFWMAGMIALAGKSIFAARFSLLIFQTIAFIVAMCVSRKHLLVGLTALMWGLVRPFYSGHMLLYTSFAGVSLFVVLVVTYAILDEMVTPGWKHWSTLALFSWIAFLSGPLSLYAILVSLAFLLLKHPASGLKTGLLLLAGLTIPLLLLAVTGALQPFWQSAILFNAQVYDKYAEANPVRLTDFFTQVFTGLGIPFGQWFNFDPFKPIQIGYAQIDAWFFTGFLYRLGLISAALTLILKRKISAGAYLYLFAAGTLLIARIHFRSQAFILVALTGLAVLAVEGIQRDRVKPALASAARTVRVIALVMALWLGVRLIQQVFLDRADFSYESNFRKYERDAMRLDRLACGRPDVRLAHYPEGVYSYWFSGLQPASKYIFMWPWVAEVGQAEMIRELEGEQYVIVIVTDELVWDEYATSDYLRPLLDYLDANYHKLSKETYISPALFNACPQ